MLIDGAAGTALLGDHEAAGTTLTIGLVGAAKKPGGERHFEKLLAAAAPGRVTLRHFTLGEDLDALRDADLDGLIVAGAEPRAGEMAAEPLWPNLARLVDWAGEHTGGTIWSCFAAHAAVYRLDGIARERLPQKLSGIIACTNTGLGPMAGLPARMAMPHSRCNTLSEDDLLDHGYTILSRTAGFGADMFAKEHGRSQFLFMQGHGEYAPRTLLAEYNRDIGRFLSGARADYPDLPVNYFKPATEAAFLNLREQALDDPEQVPLAGLGGRAVQLLDQDWHAPTCKLYAAWLADLAKRAGKT